jgi:hypothetical protein
MEAAPAADRRAAAISALRAARDAGDVAAIIDAVLSLPNGQQFGVHPGQIPALVYEIYAETVEPAARCRLAAALARAWVYGGDATRADSFAAEALELAERLDDAEILTGALDAMLLCRWGPDDYLERLRLAARLADTAAHLAASEPRLSAHLWRLTTAWECLDLLAVQRQLRALDVLAEESGSARARFFAVTRRAMYALVTGELGEADGLIQRAETIGAEAAEPDLAAVLHSLAASRAARVGDRAVLEREAADFEAFGTEQGIASVVAEAAVLWLHAGFPARATLLARRLAGPGLETIARDVDFLLIVASLVEVSAATGGLHDIVEAGAGLLSPYAGRAILNAGAVSFHGVVDDYLGQAHGALGNVEATRWRASAAACYQRLGAHPWSGRLQAGAPVAVQPLIVALHQETDGSWTVGRFGATARLPELRGLHHLRVLLQRPGQDVSALELAAAVAGHPGATLAEAGGELIDLQALQAYRKRLAELDQELAEAESWMDPVRTDRLAAERGALLDEVARATGIGGRLRQFASSPERARTAVRKAIAAAFSRVEEHDPMLARLLRDTVHTGSNCRYEPDPARPVTWRLDASADPR